MLSRWRKRLKNPKKFEEQLAKAQERCIKVCETPSILYPRAVILCRVRACHRGAVAHVPRPGEDGRGRLVIPNLVDNGLPRNIDSK